MNSRTRVIAALAQIVMLTSLMSLTACGGSGSTSSAPSTSTSTSSSLETTIKPTEPPTTVAATDPSSSLPTLESFRTQGSDRFLVDYDVLEAGHPFKGKRAATPHTGAHVHFATSAPTWPTEGSAPNTYPKIYAVADGVVGRVDDSFHVGSNDRYGVSINIARGGDVSWSFDYSIEPMVPEPSAGFYAGFIAVHQGDVVHKGDVIAYMYAPPKANGTHIHFQLTNSNGGTFMAPAIFTPAVVAEFQKHWGGFGYDGDQGKGPQMGTCMGWMLDADENPFGTGAVDCL